MTIRVPRLMPTLHGPAADIDHPGSSGQFARPAAEALAHLGGYVLRGMTAVIVGRTYTSTQTVRWYHYRSPNCDYLLIWLRLGDVSQSAAQITGQAGTGTAQTISAYYPAMGAGTVQRQMLLPWGATDSGYQEVTLTIAYAGIQDVMCCEVYRDVLDPASDDAVQQTDSSASLGGLGEGQYIIASSTAGLQGILTETADVWNSMRRTALVWSGDEIAVTATTWTNPFDSATFAHRARLKKAESTRDYRVYVHCRYDGLDSGQWRVSSSGDVVTSAALTHTTGAWTGSPLTGLAVTTGSDDTLTFEAQVISGTLYVDAITIIEG